MTDTPRTTADLLSRAPDNTDGDILPQLLRDFMVSVPSNLEISKRVATAFRVGTHLPGTFDALTGASLPTSIPPGAANFAGVRMVADVTDSQSAIWDPNAWIDPNPYGPEPYWGITHPASSTFKLPEGIYNYAVRVDVLGAAINSTTLIMAGFDYAQDFSVLDSFSAPYELTNDNNKVFAENIADTRYYVNGSIAVSQLTHFMPYAYVQNNPNALHLAGFQAWVFKVA